MKNQNDIIISVVALVLVGIVFLVAFFTKHDPVMAPAPEVIDTKMPPMPASDIVQADALPGGQGSGGGGGGFGGPGRGGKPSFGAAGVGGPPGTRPSGGLPGVPGGLGGGSAPRMSSPSGSGG
jgi:hypothetical protein